MDDRKPPHDAARVRVMLTLTLDESDRLNRARGSIPASTWCKDAVVRALATPNERRPE